MTKEETPLKARVQELQRKQAEVSLRRCSERLGLAKFFLHDKETERLVCKRCGFETNSNEIFTLHQKDCPRI